MAFGHYLQKRADNGNFEYRRRVPKAVSQLDDRKIVKHSLKTSDLRIAEVRAREFHESLETLWASLLRGEEAKTAWDRYQAGKALSGALGFAYRPAATLREWEVEDLVRRVLAAHGKGEAVADAVLGTLPEPSPKLSELWGLYERHNKSGFAGMSPNQVRKHKTPRLRARAAMLKSGTQKADAAGHMAIQVEARNPSISGLLTHRP